jgi:hypothetical protein
MPLRNGVARELAAVILVVTLRAGEIELALAAAEDLSPIRNGRAELIFVDRDRQAPRLEGAEGGQREQFPALIGQSRRLLVVVKFRFCSGGCDRHASSEFSRGDFHAE